MDKSKTLVDPSDTVQVRISDFEHGLRVFDDVQIVRIVSSNYNLLVMHDFVPTIGMINGTVEIVTNDDIETLKDIKAFYLHRDNVFSLLIERQGVN